MNESWITSDQLSLKLLTIIIVFKLNDLIDKQNWSYEKDSFDLGNSFFVELIFIAPGITCDNNCSLDKKKNR